MSMLGWSTSPNSEIIIFKAFTLYIWSTILNEDSLKVCLVIVADTSGAMMPSPLPPPVEKIALPGNTFNCIFGCIWFVNIHTLFLDILPLSFFRRWGFGSRSTRGQTHDIRTL